MPWTCLAISSESPTSSISLAPSSRAQRSPSNSARYSATLLVASPSSCVCSPSSSPPSEATTQAAAAGPGFPRAPPSTCTMTFIPSAVCPPGARSRAGERGSASEGACQWGCVPGHARPAALAHDTPLRLHRRTPTAGTAVELAPVDDHRHVRLARVVVAQLRVQLSSERPGYHAVDHRPSILLPAPE